MGKEEKNKHTHTSQKRRKTHSIHPSIFPSIHFSIHPFFHSSIFPFIHFSIHPSIYIQSVPIHKKNQIMFVVGNDVDPILLGLILLVTLLLAASIHSFLS